MQGADGRRCVEDEPRHVAIAHLPSGGTGGKMGSATLTYKDDNHQFYINAFNKGLIFSKQDIENYISELHLVPQPSFYEPCNNLEIIRRALRNLTMSFEKMGEHAKAEEVKMLLVEISDGGDLGV